MAMPSPLSFVWVGGWVVALVCSFLDRHSAHLSVAHTSCLLSKLVTPTNPSAPPPAPPPYHHHLFTL
eukprot:286669-Rhodomonas_salina.2